MNIEKLDYAFPFILFSYGILMIIMLEFPYFIRLGQVQLSEVYAQMRSHRGIAWVSFFVGGVWSLQNYWYY